ncbi:MAG TPA: YDG domain-containing protein, partial [Pseudoduganella sp.]
MPVGGVPVHGSASIATDGGRMTVTNSPNAVLDWQAFGIGARNSVHFAQQSAASQVLNRVVGNDPSAILGSLSSNGGVWLVNPHGVLFGSNARIDVGGLVASTLPISNEDFLAGRFRFDSGVLPGGQILNQGRITTSFGGRVWLMGDSVRNEGLVSSPGGNIVLAAGRSIELVDSGMPNVTVRVTAPDSQAVNLGTLLASNGGSIDVHGGIVNQQGIVRADSIGSDPAGRVVIMARGDVQLGAASETGADAGGTGPGGQVLVESADGATLVQGAVSATSSGSGGGAIHLLGRQVGIYGHARVDASGATGAGEVLAGGDYQGANPAVRNAEATYLGPAASVQANATASGDGGKVVLWSDNATRVFGSIEARGGPGGGDGGLVETSGRFLDARPKSLDVGSPRGTAGTWLLDPGNITIVDGCCGEGAVENHDGADFTLASAADDTVIAASVIIQALESENRVIVRTGGANTTQEGNITVAADIAVAGDPAGASLTLEAHNDITINAGVRITAGINPMPVTLSADSDRNNIGSVWLNEGAAIATRGGLLSLGGATLGTELGDGVHLVGSSLDAGDALVFLGGNSINVTGNSTLAGKGVFIVGNRIVFTDSTATSTDQNIAMIANGPASTGTAAVTNSTLVASAPEGLIGKIVFRLQSLDLANTRMETGSTVDIEAATTNVTAGSDVTGRDIRITARTLNVFDSQLASTNGGLDLLASAPGGGGGGTIVLRNAALAASVESAGDTTPLSIVAQNLGLTNTVLRSTGGIELLAPVVNIAANSDLTASNVAITAQRIAVADSRINAVAGGVTLFANTTTGTGGATLANVTLSAQSEGDASAGNIGIIGDTVDMTDADLTASADIAIGGASTSIDNAASVAGLRATGVSITSGTTRLDSVNVVASRAEDAIVIRTNNLTNTGSRFTTPAGRWLVYLNGSQAGFPAAALGDLDYTFVQVNAAGAPPVLSGIGNNGIVMAAPLAIKVKVDAGRPYDGTALASFSQALSHDAGTGIALQSGDDSGIARGAFDSKNAGVDKPILYEGEGGYFAVRTANGSRVYGATQSYVGDITPKAITAAGLAAANKVYDASRAAVLSGSLGGVVDGDDVTLAGATGLFDTKDAGRGKTVTISGTALAGADAGNYTLNGGATTTTADITPRPISATGITAADKVYDGTRVASLSGTLAEAIAGDNVSLAGATGLFDTKNAGTGKTVAIAGGVLAGADAGNY